MWGDSYIPRGRDEWLRGSTSWCLWCLAGIWAASSLVWLQVTRYMCSHQGIRTSELTRNRVSVNCIWLLAILWTVVCQAPLSMEFSRPEYWSGQYGKNEWGCEPMWLYSGEFPWWSSGKTLHSQCGGAGLGLIPCQGTRFCMPHSMARKLKKKTKSLEFWMLEMGFHLIFTHHGVLFLWASPTPN